MVTALADCDSAYAEYQRSHPDWGWRFRVLKAEILIWRGLAKDSLSVLETDLPAALATDEIAVQQKVTQGLAAAYLQRFKEAHGYLDAAEELASQHHRDLLGYVALAYGVLDTLQDDHVAAESFFRQALRIARDEKQTFLQANALGNLGVLSMRRQHFDEAIDWYDACLKVLRKLGNRPLEAKTLGNLGWNYYKMGDSDRALALFQEAESTAAQLGQVKDRQIWLSDMGSVYWSRRDYVNAEKYLKSALSIANQLENKDLAIISLNNLARIAADRGNFDQARQYNNEALSLNRADLPNNSKLYSFLNSALIASGGKDYSGSEKILSQLIRDSGEDVSLRWEAQAKLADAYAGQVRIGLAEQQFRAALATVDGARAALKSQEYRLSFLTTASEFYNDYIDFLVSRGKVREALAVAEHSRARTLAEGLGLTTKINNRHLYPASDAQAQEVARQGNAVILYYWLKPERSYLWAITPQKLALFNLPGQDEIDAAVQAWRKALVGPRDPLEASNPAGQKLYEMLVAPAQKLIPAGSSVVIVADGSLHGLNFETLLAPGPRPHYWIEDVEISNANSLELLAASQRKRQASGRGLLLIGDPLTAGTEFPPLARAEDEVQRVEDHFDGNQRATFTRDRATATAYRDSQPGRFAYIHFVAHGTSSRISPLDSAVVLSKEGDAYKLYARDIVQQPLHANLVTISACYGAGERAYTGEGLVGLSWAFLRAGAHNVIGALWEVNDISTPQLMDTMYTDLQKGGGPAAALRAAKLAMLHSDSVFRRPFYWAPFQLYVGS